MIKDLLYANVSQRQPRPEYTGGLAFGPASALNCGRAIYYYKTGEGITDRPDDHSELVMGIGTILHDAIRQIVERTKQVEHEVEVFGDVWGAPWRGFVDLIVDGVPCEIKSVYGAGWSDEPKDSWVAQLGIYLALLGKERGIITSIERGNGHVMEWEAIYDGRIARAGSVEVNLGQVGQKMAKVAAAIEAREMPARDFTICLKKHNGELSDNFTRDKVKYKSAWQCRYCKWYSACWRDELSAFTNSDKTFFIKGEME